MLEAPINVPLLALRDHHCREVTGTDDDGLALYCGHPKSGLTSYCTGHRRVNLRVAVGNPRRFKADTFDAKDDLEKSIALAFATIRERVANGGPTWTPGGAR